MTKVEFARPDAAAGADALAVPVPKPPAGNLDPRLARLAETGELRGSRGEAVLLHGDGERLVAAGVGARDEVDAEAFRTAGSAAAQALSRVGGTLAWQLDERLPLPLREQAAALVEGTILGSYSPGRWKSKNDTRPVERIVIAADETPELRAAVERAALVADRANRARDLANTPPNELTPATLAERAAELASEHEHLTCESLGPKEIADLAAAENMPGGGAFRPGDILRAANGKTIEVINTDAEGRLVLADALWYARREGATHVLDLATLTGAMELALGDFYAGVFANDDDWMAKIAAAGAASGDHTWPFPLHPRYRRYIDSTYADMKNGSTLRQGSPVLAAEFLQEFAGDGAWAHIDMAGPGFLERSRGDYLHVPGGTGYGVRLIAELGRLLS